MKAMTFETLVEKIAEREKEFGKESKPNEETFCLAQKWHKSKEEFAKDENRSRGQGRGQRGQYRGRGGIFNQGEKNFYRCGKTCHFASYCRNSWDKIVNKKEQVQDKGNDQGNPSESAHCNLGIEEAFSTLFSWNDTWLLDTGATCHMTFRKDFFETFSDQIDGVVHLVDKS